MVTNIIFDLDDTLIKTQAEYRKATNQFLDFMEAEGIDRKLVERRLLAVDEANVGKLGLSTRRFPTSMVDTYKELARQYQFLRLDGKTTQMVWDFGKSVFETIPPLYSGAVELLDDLHSRENLRLVLYTAGDYDLQRQKILHHKLEKYFESIFIVFKGAQRIPEGKIIHINGRKDKKALTRILNVMNFPADTTWMIGNSIRSDINPAVEIGLKAIWVDTETWNYELVAPSQHKFEVVTSLYQVRHILCKDCGAPIPQFQASSCASSSSHPTEYLTTLQQRMTRQEPYRRKYIQRKSRVGRKYRRGKSRSKDRSKTHSSNDL